MSVVPSGRRALISPSSPNVINDFAPFTYSPASLNGKSGPAENQSTTKPLRHAPYKPEAAPRTLSTKSKGVIIPPRLWIPARDFPFKSHQTAAAATAGITNQRNPVANTNRCQTPAKTISDAPIHTATLTKFPFFNGAK